MISHHDYQACSVIVTFTLYMLLYKAEQHKYSKYENPECYN